MILKSSLQDLLTSINLSNDIPKDVWIDKNNKYSINYNMDCVKLLELLPDKCITVSIVDPPYGINLQKMRLGKGAKYYKEYEMFDDSKAPDINYWYHLFRVSKYVVAFGANHYISTLEKVLGEGVNSSSWIVWDKMGRTDYADGELAWTNFGKVARIFNFLWSGFRQGDQKNKEIRIHPNHKPIPLYKYIITRFNIADMNEGNPIILDTHLGGGSSRIAAAQLGVEFLGCEINPVYFKDSNDRFFDLIIDKPTLNFDVLTTDDSNIMLFNEENTEVDNA